MEVHLAIDRPDRFANDLDWNLLRTFRVIVDAGGITAAADKLFLRQPTVSLALKRLETQIGVRLIDRGQGAFRVTAAGRELYRECVDIYGGVARLQEIAAATSEEITGNIRIALASHVATPLLDEQLALFHAANPLATYSISIDTSANVAQAVLDRRASLGICLVNKRLLKLDYTLLYREFFGFFCGPPHPLFGKSDLPMKALHGHSAVSFDTDEIEDALRPVALLRRRFNLEQSIIGQSPHLEEVRRMILCGLGIGPLPIHVVANDIRDRQLWRLPPYKDPPSIDIFLVTLPTARLNRAESEFLTLLRKAIAATPMSARTYGK